MKRKLMKSGDRNEKKVSDKTEIWRKGDEK
jgi:hypothetical protein